MIIRILYYYYKTIFLKNYLNSREKLIKYQKKQFNKLAKSTLKNSPFYRNYLDKPFHEWPIINKHLMMEHFDDINTRQIKKDDAFAIALKAETTRDFSPLMNDIAVGLSSGTSGSRGLFLTSPRERDAWVGTILAKALPDGLKAEERIAFFLRANNQLYTNLGKSKKIKFYFFDLLDDFDEHIKKLNVIQPTILSAPASVLLMLAKQRHRLTIQPPKKIISVAEVLEKSDELVISKAFNQPVTQIYQCTEGFLAISDKTTNALVMNEEFLIIEKEWLDETRFVPIVTDLLRTTQPVIRYRLDDVLVTKKTDAVFTELTAIEGRLGDVLYGKRGAEIIPIFADTCRQHMAGSPVEFEDYRIVQLTLDEFNIQVFPEPENKTLLIDHLNQLFKQKSCLIPTWQWQDYEKPKAGSKKRRIQSRLGVMADTVASVDLTGKNK
ncbi:F390 synthetase-related protein [Legionella feeleii]|uniref:Coenzyme F390 synthetase FtsA n=1 Tax=Legionella feeleii TaxID=453 RepID=A0A378IX29_9GAMM|nr:F390 synthetase-related protein [Legionella feeleii]STX39776.1 coenzyme F390 synthetase FtsA [Legionella feeleii]